MSYCLIERVVRKIFILETEENQSYLSTRSHAHGNGTNAECELHLTKKSGGREVRKDLCEIVTEHSLVIKLAALFVGYLNLSGRTSH
jgi:hypothetical protein